MTGPMLERRTTRRPIRRMAAVGALALAVLVAGCPAEDSTPTGESSAAGDGETVDAEFAEAIQGLLGPLALVDEEYVDAVADGEVVDRTEYDETVMFAEQSRLRFERLADRLREVDPDGTARVAEIVEALGPMVDEKVPSVEVRELVTEARGILEGLIGDRPPAVRGTVAMVEATDRSIDAEVARGDYRIGLIVTPVRDLWQRTAGGDLAPDDPPEGATHYLGVSLREARTKRPLPRADVRATIRDGSGTPRVVSLAERWGPVPQYGANVPLPTGEFEIEVAARPPAYARHAEMKEVAVEEVSATFPVAAGLEEGESVVVEGSPPGPVGDFRLGDDVLLGLGESSVEMTAGSYRMGFIAEAPEPYWMWCEDEGTPCDMRAVAGTDTHHLEIFLLETGTNRIVPGADVRLHLRDAASGEEVQEILLHPLLAEFYHYGATVAVPAGDYEVTVEVRPPPVGAIDEPSLAEEAEASFEWSYHPESEGDA